MAFIYEELTEEDKEFFNSFGFYKALSSVSKADPPLGWVSDREREIYFVSLGGQGYRFDEEHPPTYYRLIWKGKLIKIEGYRKGEGNLIIGNSIMYKLTRITVSESLHLKRSLLEKMIIDAFESYERGINKNLISVDFIYMATPMYPDGGVISE